MNNIRRPMMYAASFFAVGILLLYYLEIIGKPMDTLLESHIGSSTSITAKIITKESDMVLSSDGGEQVRTTLKVKTKAINGISFKKTEKLIVKYYDHTDVIPGQYVVIKGEIEKPMGRRNPGCFDYALYLRSIGIDHIFEARSIELCTRENISIPEGIGSVVQMTLYELREEFIALVEECAGEETAGMIRAIMFGSKTGIDEEVLEAFRKNGTAHVLAVSGLHVGLLYAFFSFVWRWKKGKLFFALIIVFFLAYMIMASFSPSVIRAVIMIWLHVFAVLTNRRYDMASAAFFTAISMLVVNPMHLFNTGFQMSFLAVLTLSLMIPIIKKIYSGIFMASMAIQLGLLPYTIYVFNYISLAAVVVNVPIIYLTGLIVPMGMCSMAVMLIFEPFAEVLIQCLGGLCTIMMGFNDMTAIEGVTVFDVVSPPLWMVAVYYLILLVFVSEDGRLLFMRKRHGLIRKLAYGILVASLIFNGAAGNDFKKSDLVFVDVGQGDCMHIRSGKKGDYLVDGGGSITHDIGKNTLKPYLLKNGARSVDGAFVTHLHTDHYKGIVELCREDMVERLYVYEGYMAMEDEIIKDTGLDPEQIIYLHAGQKVMISNDISVEILWPEKRSIREYERLTEGEEDENMFSLILKITIAGRTMLATGDVDTKCLDALAQKYGADLDIDILKAAHHGSKYSDSDAFAEVAKPEHVVFQVGKNNFGHPNEGIVEKFRRKGIMVYRNDLDGAVAFRFERNGYIRVRTVRGESL